MDVEQVWSDYRSRIRAFLRARVANPADVDDLLQDISIKVFTGLSGVDDQSRLQPWLFQTANRTIIDHYRKSGRHNDLHPDDLWYQGDDTSMRQDLEGCVEPFISALPRASADLLTAVDINGQSQKDYADARGIPYSTLKSQVQKARSELRSVFEDCCRLTLDTRGSIADYDVKSDRCKNC
ncbi:RNA polymerase sigma factor SigZ [Primorskyibacter sp. S87]|uniref:RNA polymerase sigma factor SigZ n=1 Tax=Primorskyibacter sp. S87 TaxID=3415126 RepID=UPI003C7986CD